MYSKMTAEKCVVGMMGRTNAKLRFYQYKNSHYKYTKIRWPGDHLTFLTKILINGNAVFMLK